jgi:hypothetical protein
MVVVVEGDEGADMLDSERIGSVDVWMTGDEDRTRSCALEVRTNVSREVTFDSREDISLRAVAC